jgi:hypothetical protein
VTDSVTLISHPNKSFAGAVDLKLASDGWLLAVTRTPLACACRRLREEGHRDDTMVLIVDSYDAVPVIAGKIGDVLR